MTVSEKRRLYDKKYYQAVTRNKQFACQCSMCGTEFVHYKPNKKRCPDCAEKVVQTAMHKKSVITARREQKREARYKLCQKIKRLCKTHSQTDVARMMGVSQPYINAILKTRHLKSS